MTDIKIVDYRPGSLAEVVKMHMTYYSEKWGFGLPFETKVASELSEFLNRYIPQKDLFLLAYHFGECVGSISLDSQDASGKGGHVRWFIVDEKFAGNGVGRVLLTKVINHCDALGVDRSFLTVAA